MAVTTEQIQTVKDWGVRVGIGDDLLDCLERMKETYEEDVHTGFTPEEEEAFRAVFNGFNIMFHCEPRYFN